MSIAYWEKMGFDAERNNQNPHEFWQKAEHLKREKNDKEKRNSKTVDRKGRRDIQNDVASGETRGNDRSGAE